MLFIYNQKDVDIVEKYLNNLLENREMVNLLETEFITFFLDNNCKEAKDVTSSINDILIIPCCIFMYNPFNYDVRNPNIILEKIVIL